jgi:dihydroorotase-like cyclic amidohydrolase
LQADLILKEGRIYTNERIIKTNLAINDDKIIKIGKCSNFPKNTKTINLKGLLLLPGIIDPHVHLRDQNLSEKEDFLSGTTAAANGGVTLAIDMPNNDPNTNKASRIRERVFQKSMRKCQIF